MKNDVRGFAASVAEQQAEAAFVAGCAVAAIRLMADFAAAHKTNSQAQLTAALQLFSQNMAALVETRDPDQSMDAVDSVAKRLGLDLAAMRAQKATMVQ